MSCTQAAEANSEWQNTCNKDNYKEVSLTARFLPPASILTSMESCTILEKDFQCCSLSDAGPRSLLKTPGLQIECGAAKLKGQAMEGVRHLQVNLAAIQVDDRRADKHWSLQVKKRM